MRLLALLLIALIAFAIVMVVKRPELVKEFWLWIIGLAGIIIQVIKMIKDFLVKAFSKISADVKEKKIF